ncbi:MULTISPECIES: threonine/serine dehydratase [unclassified Idiomarina]|uniref:threonine ammonia-lyase n=1 Tax=unclassified Idiomarina TaxID=2614829 RepID=UPI000C92B80E|nr:MULTISPECIES: threonine/serine dehydratase [unclassified Idiomarina]MAD53555.1 serine/threonine dehydratase [Idiomarinaceae bacterium]NQZ03135.1 threonine/serine dehydratase [Idiomarina sp.]|tara:strand:+ start:4087 stop:5034 length:948 start_codon:yes stop_codon:yes gene_type:complete
MPKISLPRYDDIVLAANRLEGFIKHTPVLTCSELNDALDCEVFFKCENLQKSGAFKYRGASNALLSLSEQQRKAGVFTVSSGNHGAALGYAGARLGISVTVAVPNNAPAIKRNNIEASGATIVTIEPGMEARERFAAERAHTGETFIPPYDHPDIIAGQGTATLELLKQVEDLDAVITPLGGGGLLAGACLAARGLEVYGAEPVLANDGFESLSTGIRQPAKPPRSICDGLLTQLGEYNFEILKRHVSAVLVVEDKDTKAAMELIWQRLKIIIEPSSAITLAALKQERSRFAGKRVGIILSGGNIAAEPSQPLKV